jgi:hypothetical protein
MKADDVLIALRASWKLEPQHVKLVARDGVEPGRSMAHTGLKILAGQGETKVKKK